MFVKRSKTRVREEALSIERQIKMAESVGNPVLADELRQQLKNLQTTCPHWETNLPGKCGYCQATLAASESATASA